MGCMLDVEQTVRGCLSGVHPIDKGGHPTVYGVGCYYWYFCFCWWCGILRSVVGLGYSRGLSLPTTLGKNNLTLKFPMLVYQARLIPFLPNHHPVPL